MAEEKTSVLLSDVSIEGEVVEKDKIIFFITFFLSLQLIK